MAEDPSIEQLQKELAELKKTSSERDAELEALKKTNAENTKALEDSRKLNTKLLLNNPSSGATPDIGADEEKEDTVDSIVDDVVSSVNKQYLKRYGIE